jgi:hypothetical protein
MPNWISTYLARIWAMVQEIAGRLNQLVTILAQLSAISTKLDALNANQVATGELLESMGAVLAALTTTAGIITTTADDTKESVAQNTVLLTAIRDGLTATDAEVGKILEILTPPPPVAFRVTLTEGEDHMAKAVNATMDFQLLDNGSATATLTPIDSVGEPTTLPAGVVPAWSSSDPAVVVVPAADGMSAALAPASPPVLATGVVITASATLPSGAAITGSGNPIDVVAGGPAGFSIAEQ